VVTLTLPECPTPTWTPTPTPSPASTSDFSLLPLPDINAIPDVESTPISVKEKTIAQYWEIRKALYNQDRQIVDQTGKIRDDILIALIISAEFGVFKDMYLGVYKEALEAVSNQYDSGRKIHFSNPGNMLCYGQCTIETQISWLYDMEGIRAGSFIQSKVTSRLWESYLPDGQLAVNGYANGTNSSWFWGNVSTDELCKYLVVEKVYWEGLYPGKPYFIVHSGRSGAKECK
jgi:hypothetical protein